MEKLTLSHEELCFALLIESHTVVCQYLFDYVVSAIKDRNPEKWKEIICSCFSASVKDHVKQRLENNLPLTDFYAICKLFRCRINDIGNFHGGRLLDPHEKERLCLQVQGVETARHWVFHDEQYVTVEEVRSSIGLLFATIGTCELSSGSTDVRSAVSVLEVLSRLYAYTESLLNGQKDNTSIYVLQQSTIRSALLYSSLRELQQNFKSHFQRQGKFRQPTETCNHWRTSCSGEAADKADDFPRFLKKVQNSLKEKRTTKRLKIESESQKGECILKCKNILAARNALAHSGKRTMSQIREAISEIHTLLSFFKLCCEKTNYSLKRITTQIDSEIGHSVSCGLMTFTEECLESKQSWKRILRMKGHNCVGRAEEISTIKIAFQDYLPTIQLVLIFGQAGVGKSFLAGEIAQSLSNTHQIQVWLSCSNFCDLRQDYSQSFHSSSSERGISPTAGGRNMRLLILDDVRSSTMHLAWKLIQGSGHMILTTRSTVVKQFFKQVVPTLTVVNLNPFSLAESWTLLQKKTVVSKFDSPTLEAMKTTLSDVLGNLPLCVSIYSSFMAFTAKNDHLGLALGFECLSTEHWRGIEERFGDCFHVRGLTGILQSAEMYLEDQPLVVFLLMKICSQNTNNISWKFLSKGDRRRLRVIIRQTNIAWLDDLLNGVLGVTDWLFSESGQCSLETCRDTLEELGLIGWDSTTSTVSVHSLTLKKIYNMLERRSLFVNHFLLIFLSGRKYSDNGNLPFSAEHLFQCLSAELLLNAISRSLSLILETAKTSLEDQTTDSLLYAIQFLGRVSQGNTLPILKKLLSPKQLDSLYRYIAAHLHFFNDSLSMFNAGFKVKNGKLGPGLEHLRLLFLNRTNVDFVNALLLSERQWTEQDNAYFYLAPQQPKDSSPEEISMIAIHLCREALMTQPEMKSKPMKEFLLDASCRIGNTTLFTQPTASSVRHKIVDLITKDDTDSTHKYRKCFNDEENKIVELWCYIAAIRGLDSLQENSEVDKATREIALFLIILSQQRQRSIEEAIRQLNVMRLPNTSTADWLNVLNTEYKNEAKLWISLRKPGRTLRVLVKTFYILKANILEYAISNTNRTWGWNSILLWLSLQDLAHACSTYSFEVGQLSGVAYYQTLWEHVKELEGDASLQYNQLVENYLSPSNCSKQDILKKVLEKNCSINEALQNLLESHDFETTLNRLVSLLDDSLNSENTYQDFVFIPLPGNSFIALDYIACLCGIVGQSRRKDIIKTLQKSSERSRKAGITSWTDAVSKAITIINKEAEQEEVSSLFALFNKSVQAFVGDDCLFAHKISTRSWRTILGFLRNMRTGEDSYVFRYLLRSMLLRVSHNLQRLYAMDLKHDTAEWFLKFRYQTTHSIKWFFLAGQIGVEYVEFLKERGRLREAHEQCRLVQRLLVNEFGDDYQEWLPDAPNLLETLRELECID